MEQSRAETSYWMDDFLQVRQRQDEYFETQETTYALQRIHHETTSTGI